MIKDVSLKFAKLQIQSGAEIDFFKIKSFNISIKKKQVSFVFNFFNVFKIKNKQFIDFIDGIEKKELLLYNDFLIAFYLENKKQKYFFKDCNFIKNVLYSNKLESKCVFSFKDYKKISVMLKK